MEGIRSHIVLVGFMGSGKSTIGRLLAGALEIDFVDVDNYIEAQENRSIKDIFLHEGESEFRKMETVALKTILSREGLSVIATGGGAPCFNNNMKLIVDSSVSIYLKVGKVRLVERLKNDNQRPLLQNKNETELLSYVKNILQEREQFYRRSTFTLRAIDPPEVLIRRIMKNLTKTNR